VGTFIWALVETMNWPLTIRERAAIGCPEVERLIYLHSAHVASDAYLIDRLWRTAVETDAVHGERQQSLPGEPSVATTSSRVVTAKFPRPPGTRQLRVVKYGTNPISG